MQQINKYIQERLHINKDISNYYNYHPTTRDELQELVDKLVKERGNEADLNDIDTSKITDMNYIFYNSKFNGDISEWDVSNVKNMSYIFYDSKFTGKNGDISNWDAKKVKTMKDIFNLSPLEKNPPKWYK